MRDEGDHNLKEPSANCISNDWNYSHSEPEGARTAALMATYFIFHRELTAPFIIEA